MRKTIHSLLLPLFLLVATVSLSFGQPSRGPASVRNPYTIDLLNEGKTHPALREKLDSSNGTVTAIVLDTTEIDTGFIFFNVTAKPHFLNVDTVGVFSFTCKDSTGSDTINVIGKWMGNPRCDGKGTWENVDSVTYIGATSATANAPTPASSSYSNKRGFVVNSGGFCLYKFHLRNPFTTAARKASCKDAVFITRPRGGFRP